MTVDLRRCRAELEILETEILQWSVHGPANLDQWMHKMYALIGDVLDPNDALAIRLTSVPNQSGVNAKRMLLEIIESLRWEIVRRMPATDPFSESTIDPQLWAHVQGLIAAADWEKVAREAAVFVEDKLRQWAKIPPSITGSVNVLRPPSDRTGLSFLKRLNLVSSKDGSSSLLDLPSPFAIQAVIRSTIAATQSGTPWVSWGWQASY